MNENFYSGTGLYRVDSWLSLGQQVHQVLAVVVQLPALLPVRHDGEHEALADGAPPARVARRRQVQVPAQRAPDHVGRHPARIRRGLHPVCIERVFT